jgi:hypothetical protein
VPDGSITTRLDRIEQKQADLLVAIQELRDSQQAARETLADVVAEIGGAPPRDTRGDRPTIRDSVHELRAVCSPVAIEGSFRKVLSERRGMFFTRWQRGITVTGVIIASVFTVLRFLGYGG